MKKLFLALALVSGVAQADTWSMPNQGGGKVVLTDRECKGYPSLRESYAYTSEGYWSGCWTIIDGKVHMVAGDERRVYELKSFKPDHITPKKKGTSL